MTPAELAGRHPRLFHLTAAANLPLIRRQGLLSTTALLGLLGTTAEDRARVEQRRARFVTLAHPTLGVAVINDNSPLHEKSLAACLDDGLKPADWLAMLNERVFFWVRESALETLMRASRNMNAEKKVLVFDTMGLVSAHAGRVELSAINSGATVRKPPRRGLKTFTPLGRHSFAEWRDLRGHDDQVREVTVVGAIADAADHLRQVWDVVDGEVISKTDVDARRA